ncbi:MAG TPA: DUF4892 domain-containing protein [Gammaproteobacteria bacterium]|nr:DUF4892 domain-containing protein [Gammaproteobacteria bacterium]
MGHDKLKWSPLVIVFAVSTLANVDVPESFDVRGIDRFPRSWIVLFEAAEESRPHEFIVGPVDKMGQEVRFERAIRVEGEKIRVTYQIPPGFQLAEVLEHYEKQMRRTADKVLFRCHGPACGRSSIWANDVFGIRLMTAPNRNQYYLAATFTADEQQSLVAVYLVERGNKRIYVHVEQIVTGARFDFDGNRNFAERLAKRGFVRIDGIVPNGQGALDENQLEQLDVLAESLTSFAGQQVYVVCHLYGSMKVDKLLERSEECAELAAERIAEVSGVTTIPFGTGPMAPTEESTDSRLELVLPSRLRSE